LNVRIKRKIRAKKKERRDEALLMFPFSPLILIRKKTRKESEKASAGFIWYLYPLEGGWKGGGRKEEV